MLKTEPSESYYPELNEKINKKNLIQTKKQKLIIQINS